MENHLLTGDFRGVSGRETLDDLTPLDPPLQGLGLAADKINAPRLPRKPTASARLDCGGSIAGDVRARS